MNAYCTIQELADALRVTVTAANTDRLTLCCETAAQEIDAFVDSPDPPDYSEPWNPAKNSVNVFRAAELWKTPDALFGVIGYDQTGAIRTSRNGFARYATILRGLKQQFGVA